MSVRPFRTMAPRPIFNSSSELTSGKTVDVHADGARAFAADIHGFVQTTNAPRHWLFHRCVWPRRGLEARAIGPWLIRGASAGFKRAATFPRSGTFPSG